VNLIGLRTRVELPTLADCCGYPISTIAAGTDENLTLRCANCGALRGKVSPHTAQTISKVIDVFGAPERPIILRRKVMTCAP
jgi:hypothetical protein